MCVNPALYLGYKFGHHAISRMNFNESQHYFLTSADRDITEFMDEYISYNIVTREVRAFIKHCHSKRQSPVLQNNNEKKAT